MNTGAAREFWESRQKRPGYWISRAAHMLRVRIMEATKLAGSKLTPEESALLLALDDLGGKLQMADFVLMTGRDKSTITRQIDGLEKKGMASRATGQTDGREVYVVINAKGKKEMALLTPYFEQIRKGMVQGVSKQKLRITLETLAQLKTNLEEFELEKQ